MNFFALPGLSKKCFFIFWVFDEEWDWVFLIWGKLESASSHFSHDSMLLVSLRESPMVLEKCFLLCYVSEPTHNTFVIGTVLPEVAQDPFLCRKMQVKKKKRAMKETYLFALEDSSESYTDKKKSPQVS